jgi:cAMP-dependent protein kinase regulator
VLLSFLSTKVSLTLSFDTYN